MNYTWLPAAHAISGMIAYRPIIDATIARVDPAGDLHIRLSYDDGTNEILPLYAPVMVQCHHRRCYETSTHHQAIL